MSPLFLTSSHLAGYNTTSLCADVHSVEKPSQLGCWATALHSSLAAIQSALWNKCNATMHRQWQFSFQSWIIEVPMRLPFTLNFLWCKIEYKSLFCQMQFEESRCWESYFAIVAKTHREKFEFCSLLPFGSPNPVFSWRLPAQQNTFCMAKAMPVSE